MKPEQKFVARLSILFGEPNTKNLTAMLAEYENAVKRQSASTLHMAGDILARTHKVRTWPTIAEVLDAVSKAKKSAKYASSGLVPIENFDAWWRDRTNRISHARSETEIQAEIAEIEPYWQAKWIHPDRMPQAQQLADERRKELRMQRAKTTIGRMVGERDV